MCVNDVPGATYFGKHRLLVSSKGTHLLEHVTWPAQDAGLENMALEVGTVQGGQIAALQDGKDGALGKPRPALTWRLSCCPSSW